MDQPGSQEPRAPQGSERESRSRAMLAQFAHWYWICGAALGAITAVQELIPQRVYIGTVAYEQAGTPVGALIMFLLSTLIYAGLLYGVDRVVQWIHRRIRRPEAGQPS
jgi:hypothetical protein